MPPRARSSSGRCSSSTAPSVLATPTQLGGATVTAKVVGDARGPKIDGFTYKPKTNNRRRWGHRQKYTTIEITAITKG